MRSAWVWLALAFGVPLVAGLLGECMPPTGPAPSSCSAGLDLELVGRDHRAAWSAAFDGRPLTDAELVALGDAQALIDCLARAKK